MAKEIVLDVETTGLKASEGHRVIELAAVELDSARIGRRWHSLFDPEREVEPAAAEIHGWTWPKLKGQPKFADLADDFIAFCGDAKLIAHNALFDASFVEAEMERCKRPWKAEWIDTLPIARKKHPRGMRHNLDALCKHYGIRKNARKIHSAIHDTILLAEVYVRLIGRLDQLALDGIKGGEVVYLRGGEMVIVVDRDIPHPGPRPTPLPGRVTKEELRAHESFIQQIERDRLHATNSK